MVAPSPPPGSRIPGNTVAIASISGITEWARRGGRHTFRYGRMEEASPRGRSVMETTAAPASGPALSVSSPPACHDRAAHAAGAAVGEPAQVMDLQVRLALRRDERRRLPAPLAEALGSEQCIATHGPAAERRPPADQLSVGLRHAQGRASPISAASLVGLGADRPTSGRSDRPARAARPVRSGAGPPRQPSCSRRSGRAQHSSAIGASRPESLPVGTDPHRDDLRPDRHDRGRPGQARAPGAWWTIRSQPGSRCRPGRRGRREDLARRPRSPGRRARLGMPRCPREGGAVNHPPDRAHDRRRPGRSGVRSTARGPAAVREEGLAWRGRGRRSSRPESRPGSPPRSRDEPSLEPLVGPAEGERAITPGHVPADRALAGRGPSGSPPRGCPSSPGRRRRPSRAGVGAPTARRASSARSPGRPCAGLRRALGPFLLGPRGRDALASDRLRLPARPRPGGLAAQPLALRPAVRASGPPAVHCPPCRRPARGDRPAVAVRAEAPAPPAAAGRPRPPGVVLRRAPAPRRGRPGDRPSPPGSLPALDRRPSEHGVARGPVPLPVRLPRRASGAVGRGGVAGAGWATSIIRLLVVPTRTGLPEYSAARAARQGKHRVVERPGSPGRAGRPWARSLPLPDRPADPRGTSIAVCELRGRPGGGRRLRLGVGVFATAATGGWGLRLSSLPRGRRGPGAGRATPRPVSGRTCPIGGLSRSITVSGKPSGRGGKVEIIRSASIEPGTLLGMASPGKRRRAGQLTESSTSQHPPEGLGVANRLGMTVVVEVDEHLAPLRRPLPDAVGTPRRSSSR